MNVGDVMTRDVVTCRKDETLKDAALKMQRENIGCCPVVDGNELVGIVTDRDITIRAVSLGADVTAKTVQNVMTPSPITGEPSMSLEEAARVMSNNQIRRLPIVDGTELVGIIALADLAIDLEEDDILAETLTSISEPSR